MTITFIWIINIYIAKIISYRINKKIASLSLLNSESYSLKTEFFMLSVFESSSLKNGLDINNGLFFSSDLGIKLSFILSFSSSTQNQQS